MRFTPDFLERVLGAINIVDLIGQYTELKRSGHNLMGLCPFPDHREKTASFSVSETKQAYHCFGCKKGGNAFSFLRDYQGLSFPEAVEVLASRANIPLPEPEHDRGAGLGDNKKLLLKVSRHAAVFFHKSLKEVEADAPVLEYVKKRGLTPETIEKFKLGFAPESWDALVQYFQRAKAPVNMAENIGLIKKRTGGRSGYYDVLRNRLIFPIISPTGDVVGFGGRSLGDENPKYLNSSDSPIFHKGRILYGLNESARYLRSEDQAIVVEGYMDYLGLYQAGITNVVAPLGTAFTPEHAKIIKRYTKNVVVLFDGDQAGQEAAERVLPILLAEGLYPKGITLPDEMDPDEYVLAHGAAAMRGLLKSAPDLFLSHFERLVKKIGTRPADKVRILDEVAPILRAIPDARLLDLYLQEMGKWLEVDRNWLLRGLKLQGTRPQPVSQAAKPSNNNDLGQKMPTDELILLNLILAKEAYLLDFIEQKGIEIISHPILKELAVSAIERYGQNPKDFDKLTAYLSSRVQEPGLLTRHLDERQFQLDEEKGRQLMNDCLQKARNRHLKGQARRVLNEIKAQDNTEKLEQFVNIVKTRRNLEKDN